MVESSGSFGDLGLVEILDKILNLVVIYTVIGYKVRLVNKRYLYYLGHNVIFFVRN